MTKICLERFLENLSENMGCPALYGLSVIDNDECCESDCLECWTYAFSELIHDGAHYFYKIMRKLEEGKEE